MTRPKIVDELLALPTDGISPKELMVTLNEREWFRTYIEALERDRADAERYRHLRGGIPRTTGRPKAGRIEIMQWEDRCEANVLKGEKLDAAIDAQTASAAEKEPSRETPPA